MELLIGTRKITKWNEMEITLRYDRIADQFKFTLLFQPERPEHKEIFLPGAYNTCKIFHRGVLVMTGTMLNPEFTDAGDPPDALVTITGYTITGILGDCTVLNTDSTVDVDGASVTSVPSQFTGLSLTEIAKQICAGFPIEVVIDPEVQGDADSTYSKTEMKIDETMEEYLDKLCKQKQIVLSHDADGRLVLTRAKTNALLTTSKTLLQAAPTPVDSAIAGAPQETVSGTVTSKSDRAILFDFTPDNHKRHGGKWVKMRHGFNGQGLHSVIQVVGQFDGGNAIDVLALNPFVQSNSTPPFRAGLRYKRVMQTSGDGSETPLTARAIAGDELKGITMTIEIEGWELGGHLVTPGQMITVTNPKVYCYSKTKWFIQEVVFFGNEVKETATITCVLPECFNKDAIVNVYQ
jgi:prophage tail gpP-like protein